MPKISKKLKPKTKIKSVTPKKKKVVIKSKPVITKKKVIKKVVTKKTNKVTPVISNKIAIDVISDEDVFSQPTSSKESIPVFSSWPDFKKTEPKNELENKLEPEDIYSEDETEESSDESKNKINNEIGLDDREDFDKQKKFFSEWASQVKPKEGEEKPTLAPNKKSIGLYRRQALFYLGATAILLLAVFYIFFSKLTILISPQGETLNDSLTFNISSSSTTSPLTDINSNSEAKYNKNIYGEAQVIEVSSEKIYQTSGEEVLGEEVIGKVTLINKYNKNQPLVVNTRLLSADGKLFRLKEATNVPAGGQVTINVYADKPSAEMAITNPSHFTIPGLWAGIQDQIYGESEESFTYQTQVKKYIKQRDLDSAKKDISEVLDLKVKNDLKITGTDKVVIYGINGDATDDNITIEYNAKLGESKEEFIVKAKKKVVVVTFPKEKAISLAQARLSLLVPDDKELSNFNKEQITYTLESFDENTKTAVIKAYFSGSMSLKSNSSLFDRKKLVGLNREQISEYLDSFPEIKSYELNFSPSFISTAPTIPDKINIKIQN